MSSDSNPDASTLLWVLWGALLVSVALYGVVAVTIGASATMQGSTLQNLIYVLVGISIAMIPSAYVVRQKMYFEPLSEGEFSDREERQGQYFTVSIITWALCEAVAIYGLVLRILSGDLELFYPFALTSVALFLVFRPRPERDLEPADDSAPADSASESDAEW